MPTSLTSAATASAAVRNARPHRGRVVAQPIDGTTVRERVDERRSDAIPHHLGLAASVLDALNRVGERLAREARRVVEHVGDGHADKVVVVERQLDAAEQQAVRLLLQHGGGRRLGHAGALHKGRHPRGDPCGALGGALARQRCLRLRPQLVEALGCSTMLSGGQAASVSSTSPATTVGRRAAASCCSGGSTTGGPSNTSRSAAPTIRSMIERSSSCPAEPTTIQPKPASQQRACSVVRNRTASAPSLIVT